MTTPEPPPEPDSAAAAPPPEPDWQRQSPLLILLAGWDSLREGLVQIVFGAAAFQADAHYTLRALFVILIGAQFLPVLWVWFLTRHRLADGAIEVRSGLVFSEHTILPLDRIQAADRTSGVLQRLFGLVRLKISSGAAGTQVDLKALRPAQAASLLSAIDAVRASEASPAGDAEGRPLLAPQTEDLAGDSPPSAPGRLQGPGLGPARILALSLTSGRALAMLLAGWALFNQFAQAAGASEEETTSLLTRGLQSLEGGGIWGWSALALLSLSALVAASVVEVTIRWGGFGLEATPQELHVSQGLLERKVVTLRRDKLQALRVVEPLLLSLFGYLAVDVDVIGHSDQRGEATRLHPALRRAELPGFLRDFLPRFCLEGELITPPRRARIRFWIKPILVLLGALALSAGASQAYEEPLLLAGTLAALPGLWLAGRRYRETGLLLAPDHVLLQSFSGWTRTRAYVPRQRVQSAWASSSWLQRRRDLATAGLRVASGATGRDFEARDLDPAQAARLLTWLRGPAPQEPEAPEGSANRTLSSPPPRAA